MPKLSPAQLFSFTPREAKRLFFKAKPVHSTKPLEIRIAPTKNTHGRLLIVVSKKVGNAPERNQLKRRLKAIFYENRLFEKQQDAIVLIRSALAADTFDDLKKLLMDHL